MKASTTLQLSYEKAASFHKKIEMHFITSMFQTLNFNFTAICKTMAYSQQTLLIQELLTLSLSYGFLCVCVRRGVTPIKRKIFISEIP